MEMGLKTGEKIQPGKPDAVVLPNAYGEMAFHKMKRPGAFASGA